MSLAPLFPPRQELPNGFRVCGTIGTQPALDGTFVALSWVILCERTGRTKVAEVDLEAAVLDDNGFLAEWRCSGPGKVEVAPRNLRG